MENISVNPSQLKIRISLPNTWTKMRQGNTNMPNKQLAITMFFTWEYWELDRTGITSQLFLMHVDVQVMWLIRKLTDWAWEEVWLGGLKNAVRQPLASGIVGSVRRSDCYAGSFLNRCISSCSFTAGPRVRPRHLWIWSNDSNTKALPSTSCSKHDNKLVSKNGIVVATVIFARGFVHAQCLHSDCPFKLCQSLPAVWSFLQTFHSQWSWWN